MSVTIKISETGSVEIPRSVLEANGWTAGTELEIVERGREVLLRPKAPLEFDAAFPPVAVEEFLASVPVIAEPHIGDDEIKRVVREEAMRRFDAKTRR